MTDSGTAISCADSRGWYTRPMKGRRFGAGGRLELVEKLGEGASGHIWRCYDHKKSRDVAVKFLHATLEHRNDVRERFLREGQRIGRIRHPNLVRIYGLGREGNELYIVCEFVAGQTLFDILHKEGALATVEALTFARDIAAGLTEAHRHGIVHRDLKPANVMVRDEDGAVKVLDFGIAKDLNARSNITRRGSYIGTPAYSAPEQILGDEIDARCDIFSLGVMLYEMITGPLPRSEGFTTELFRATLEETRVPLGDLHHRVTRPVAFLIQRMTRRDPARRPASMEEVRTQADQLVQILRQSQDKKGAQAISGHLKKLLRP
ncbi:MAG TPA: serine/threonine-protein kinase [Planctomycetota bacterium]|jgi:serine/threonine-protein kinase|nr:serine/threonine-protein kinase [Planctomycetota bacterium]